MLRTLPIKVLLILSFALTGCSMFRSTPMEDLTIAVNDSAYTPAMLEVSIGHTVKLTLNNDGREEHHFAIQRIALQTSGGSSEHNMAGMSGTMSNIQTMPELHLAAAPGATASLEFTPVQAGEYEFFCILPNHRERGTLVVKSA